MPYQPSTYITPRAGGSRVDTACDTDFDMQYSVYIDTGNTFAIRLTHPGQPIWSLGNVAYFQYYFMKLSYCIARNRGS